MIVIMQTSFITGLDLLGHLATYYRTYADACPAPHLCTRLIPHELAQPITGWDGDQRWLAEPDHTVEVIFTTSCGNEWAIRIWDAQVEVTYSGSRAGWRSLHSALGASPVEGRPKLARLAQRWLARIVFVESSAGDAGADPWADGQQVKAALRAAEELLAPPLPLEAAPAREGKWRSHIERLNRRFWRSLDRSHCSWKAARRHQYRPA